LHAVRQFRQQIHQSSLTLGSSGANSFVDV
jgi:hypothetical protein